MTEERSQQFDQLFSDEPSGAEWVVELRGRPGSRGSWEGSIAFIPRDRGEARVTGVETTQPSWDRLVAWAAGLSDAFFAGAFARSTHPQPRPVAAEPPRRHGVRPTPADRASRLEHLREIERYVMDSFRDRSATELPTSPFFNSSDYSNADLVRAFEELEKKQRYLVRETAGGRDVLRLTKSGAAALGLEIDRPAITIAEPPGTS